MVDGRQEEKDGSNGKKLIGLQKSINSDKARRDKGTPLVGPKGFGPNKPELVFE